MMLEVLASLQGRSPAGSAFLLRQSGLGQGFSFIPSSRLISESIYEGTQPSVFGFRGVGCYRSTKNFLVTQRDA